MRKKFAAGFGARVALVAIKGGKSMAELSSQYGVCASMIDCPGRRVGHA